MLARLSAVENLIANWSSIVLEVRTLFKQLPDIDRLLSRVHTLGLKLDPSHPENRAVYYEANIYNKRKIKDFLTALRGLKVTLRWLVACSMFSKRVVDCAQVARKIQELFMTRQHDDSFAMSDDVTAPVLHDLIMLEVRHPVQ